MRSNAKCKMQKPNSLPEYQPTKALHITAKQLG